MLSHDYWSITNTRVINTDSIDLNQSDHLDSSLWLYFSDPETVTTNYIQWIRRSPFLSTGSSVLFLKEHTWYTWTLAPHSLHTTVIFVGIFGPFINCKYPFIWRKTPPRHPHHQTHPLQKRVQTVCNHQWRRHWLLFLSGKSRHFNSPCLKMCEGGQETPSCT